MKLLLTILIFIGLKLFELGQLLWRFIRWLFSPTVLLIILGVFLSFAFVVGIPFWLASHYKNGLYVLLVIPLGIMFVICGSWLESDGLYDLEKFIRSNWAKANKISGRKVK
jgi:hypothetical protein